MRTVDIFLPRHLDIFGNHDEMCRCLIDVPNAVFEDKSVLVRFDHVETIRPSGALALASVLQVCRQYRGSTEVTGTYPTSRACELILQDAGFFGLLGVPHRIESKARSDWVEHITATQSAGESVDTLRERVFGISADIDSDAMSNIYVGLTEAMTNVVQHAYPGELDAQAVIPFIHRRWWIPGHADRFRQTFTFVICDLGVGIPKSVSRKVTHAKVSEWLELKEDEKVDDATLLQIALMLGESRTDLPWRGKGLKQMRSVVDEIGGAIRICTGFAGCEYARRTFAPARYQVPYVGTLVEWTVPLERVRVRP